MLVKFVEYNANTDLRKKNVLSFNLWENLRRSASKSTKDSKKHLASGLRLPLAALKQMSSRAPARNMTTAE